MRNDQANSRWLKLIVYIFMVLLLTPINAGGQQNPGFPILDVEWHPTGEAYALVNNQGDVIVQNSNSGTVNFYFDGPNAALAGAAVAWSSDGGLLAAGIGHQIFVWETTLWGLADQYTAGNSDGQAYSEYFGELPEGITTLSWRSDNRFLASASISSITTVWDRQEKQVIFQSLDVSGGFPGRLWLNNEILTDGGTSLNPFSGEVTINDPSRFAGFGDVTAIDITHDGHFLAQSDVFSFVHINDMTVDSAQNSIQVVQNDPSQRRRSIADITWNTSGNIIATAMRDGEILVVNLISGQIETVVTVNGKLDAIDWNPQTNQLIYGGSGNNGSPILSTIDVTGVGGVPPILPTSTPPPTPFVTDTPFPILTLTPTPSLICTMIVSMDDGIGLISAISAANANGSSADTICLTANSTYTLTAVNNSTDGPNGLPSITSDITIVGNGATISRDPAAPAFRIFHIAASGSLTLDGVTISDGSATSASPGNDGGAIYNRGTVNLTGNTSITNSTASADGGAVYNRGTFNIAAESSISGNTAADDGGGVYTSSGTLNVTGGTITDNTASDEGGGIRSVDSTITPTLTPTFSTWVLDISAVMPGVYVPPTATDFPFGTILLFPAAYAQSLSTLTPPGT